MKEPIRKNKRNVIVFAILAVILVVFFAANLCIGNVQINAADLFDIFYLHGGDEKVRSIIMNIRLPRAIMALFLGGGLAVAGFLLQTYFSNPLAGPYILGVSSGARMMVALLLIFVAGGVTVKGYMLVLAAFFGAFLTTLFIILISGRVKNMSALLAAGIMIGYICSAVTDFLVAFADDADIVNLHSWSQGSFSGAAMEGAVYCMVIISLSFLGVLFMAKSLDAFRLGESYARSVGVNTKLCRVWIILLSCILAACVTAYAGPVAFIGIAVPFLMRVSLRTSKPVTLIPATFIAGAIFCLVSDLLARMIFAPTELNISAVTSLFGAPIVIFMIIRGHSRHEN